MATYSCFHKEDNKHNMMEELYAECLLGLHGFNSEAQYEALLNESFLNDPSNSFLLGLEECSHDFRSTKGYFMHYWGDSCAEINADAFGKHLFAGLKSVYNANAFSIADFGKHCALLWHNIPSELAQTEPFWTLCYADDCLSWGDEAQTRMLYEKAFSFYND